MPNPPVPSARLGAVNLMLSTISEAPVSQLSPAVTQEVDFAVQRLDEIDRSVQSEGWQFNTEFRVEYTPDINGIITLPTEVVRVSKPKYPSFSGSPHAPNTAYTLRAQELYDLKNHTNVFTGPVSLDIVYLLDFDLTPEAFRYYVTIKASRAFQSRFQGSTTDYRFSIDELNAARANLMRTESITQNHSLLGNPWIARILHRQTPRLPGL